MKKKFCYKNKQFSLLILRDSRKKLGFQIFGLWAFWKNPASWAEPSRAFWSKALAKIRAFRAKPRLGSNTNNTHHDFPFTIWLKLYWHGILNLSFDRYSFSFQLVMREVLWLKMNANVSNFVNILFILYFSFSLKVSF